jgi:Yip1 domain
MTPETKATPTSTEGERPIGFIGRVTGLWFSPGETFKELARRPDVLYPIIALMIIGGITGYVMIDRIGLANFFGQGMRQAVDAGRMTQEQMDQQLGAMTTGNTARFIKLSFIFFGALGNVIFGLVAAGIFKLVSMVMGIENSYTKLLSVSLYTFLAVGIISSILFVVILFLKSPDEIDIQNMVGSNLAALLTAFFSKDSIPKFVMQLGRWVDVFALWMVALLAIGYATVSEKLKTSTAGWIVGGIYACIAIVGSIIGTVRG